MVTATYLNVGGSGPKAAEAFPVEVCVFEPSPLLLMEKEMLDEGVCVGEAPVDVAVVAAEFVADAVADGEVVPWARSMEARSRRYKFIVALASSMELCSSP